MYNYYILKKMLCLSIIYVPARPQQWETWLFIYMKNLDHAITRTLKGCVCVGGAYKSKQLQLLFVAKVWFWK